MKAFNDTDTAKRFGQTAGHLRVDFAPLTENGPDLAECFLQDGAENGHKAQGDESECCTDSKKQDKGDDPRENTADELHQPRSDQIPYALDVRHNARNQRASLI